MLQHYSEGREIRTPTPKPLGYSQLGNQLPNTLIWTDFLLVNEKAVQYKLFALSGRQESNLQ